jgi:hypothetical protein
VAKLGKKVPERKTKEEMNAAPPGLEVEDLGDETVEGVAVKKVRMLAEGGQVLGWFDKATGAPLKMESTQDGVKSEIEWKDRKAEAQPAELFTVPKGYQLTDMDEMMRGMGNMQGMGGAGGMAKGMAVGMAGGLGSSLGSSLGGTIGGALGGPLGSVAGQFIGGKVGGMLGKKAANAIH